MKSDVGLMRGLLRNVDRMFYDLYMVSKYFRSIFSLQMFLNLSATFCFGLGYCIYVYNSSLTEVIDMVFVVIYSAFPIIFIFGCDATRKETERVIATCRKIGEKFQDNPEIYREIQALACKMATLKHGFTASGFFPIRRSLLLSISGAIATYFLTFEQIWRKGEKKENSQTN
ncbi:uncharacterized protein LOC115883866 [Sitophilus oryzae]|uniref:Uncharacterized protein LOC115883866 n=1 Tax=Sitophilus oryzae TaxID=7048 RepID=A0A6J2Y562_SITOR|nr:uncharacterized protein LOC115883866 [Sitophilus oryzae]